MDQDRFDELIGMICESDMTYEEMAFAMHWTPEYLKRRFKELTSQSIKDYRDQHTIFYDPKFQVSHEAIDKILSATARTLMKEYMNYICFVDRKLNLIVQKGEISKIFSLGGNDDIEKYAKIIVDKHDFYASPDYYLHRHDGVMELISAVRFAEDCIVGYVITGVFKDDKSSGLSSTTISKLAKEHNISKQQVIDEYNALPDFVENIFKNLLLLAIGGTVNGDIASRMDIDDPFNFKKLLKPKN